MNQEFFTFNNKKTDKCNDKIEEKCSKKANCCTKKDCCSYCRFCYAIGINY